MEQAWIERRAIGIAPDQQQRPTALPGAVGAEGRSRLQNKQTAAATPVRPRLAAGQQEATDLRGIPDRQAARARRKDSDRSRGRHGGQQRPDPPGHGRRAEPDRQLDEAVGEPCQHGAQPEHHQQHPSRGGSTDLKLHEGDQRIMPEIERVADEADEDQRRLSQHAMHECAAGRDQCHGRRHGDDGANAGPGRVAADEEKCDEESGRAEAGEQVAGQRGRLNNRARSPPDRHKRARQQLPPPRGRGVERPGRILRRCRETEHEGADPQGCNDGHLVRRPSGNQHEGSRPDDVVLLLNAQRPQVQQRKAFGARIEIADDLLVQHEVLDERCGALDVGPERFHLGHRQHEPRDQECRQHDGDQSRKDPQDAAGVEACKAEALLGALPIDDPGNQIARDHEEDVHAGKAARQQLRKGVVDEHRDHRDRAQPVDVGPIGQRLRRAARRRGGARGSELNAAGDRHSRESAETRSSSPAR